MPPYHGLSGEGHLQRAKRVRKHGVDQNVVILAHSLGALLPGGALQVLAFAQWMLPVAPWLGPLFHLRFSQETPLWGLVVLCLVLAFAGEISNRGAIR